VVKTVYVNGSSRKEMWLAGFKVYEGPLAPPGQTPTFPDKYLHMTPEQITEETDSPNDELIDPHYKNGKLDGMVERIHADGSRQFEEWENGHIVQLGEHVPKGERPIQPHFRPKPAPPPAPYNPPPQVAMSRFEPQGDADACRAERMEWASHYGGQALAEIQSITPANERGTFWQQALEVEGTQALTRNYPGVDPTQSPEFLSQFAVLARKQIEAAQEQLDRATPEDARSWNYAGNVTGYVWVACMGNKFLRELQTPSRNPRDKVDRCAPLFDEMHRAANAASGSNSNDDFYSQLRAMPDEAKLNTEFRDRQSYYDFLLKFHQTRNTDQLRQMSDTLTSDAHMSNSNATYHAMLVWGACVAQRLADSLEAQPQAK
jgi:hypothetical protein